MRKLTPAENQRLHNALTQVSTVLTTLEAGRDTVKSIKKDLRAEFDFLGVKALNRLVKAFHKKNADEEIEVHEEFITLYESVTGSKV